MLKGYFPVTIYARFEGISQDTAWHRVLRDEVESIIGKDGMRYVYYERQTAMDRDRPDGYLTVQQWCDKNEFNYATAQEYVRRGLIPVLKKEKHNYIPADFVYIRKKNRAHDEAKL